MNRTVASYIVTRLRTSYDVVELDRQANRRNLTDRLAKVLGQHEEVCKLDVALEYRIDTVFAAWVRNCVPGQIPSPLTVH